MKRLLALLLCLVLILSLIPAAAAEDIGIVGAEEEPITIVEAEEPTEEASEVPNAGVAINSSNFPDEVFRAYVSDFFDFDEDGRLDAAELKDATEIELPRKGVSSLKGVEKLRFLTELDCSWNDLTELDLSKNTALTVLYCAHNELTALDVSSNTALTELNCSYNQLTALDVTQNAALSVLICGYNQLTALDVSCNPELKSLDCWSNKLTKLNVSKNPLLLSLDCSWNRLTKLNLSKNTALTAFFCYENRLTALDLSHNTALRVFWCYNNQLTELDLSRNTALAELNCGGNQLTALDVSCMPDLQYLWVWGNLLSAIDLSRNTALVGFYCESNQLAELDLSSSPSLKELRCLSNPLKKVYIHQDAQLVLVEADEGVEIVRVAPTRPEITTQPKNQSAGEGDTVKFTVKATGGSLSYQWYYRRSADDGWKKCTGDDAATATLSIEAKAYRDGYQYRCKISNSAGYSYSAAATLTVLTKPRISTQPSSQTVSKGTTVQFTVKATGATGYQWYYRRSADDSWKKCTVTGYNTATLTVEAKSYRNGYQYRCKVSNDVGYRYSSAATLTVK